MKVRVKYTGDEVKLNVRERQNYCEALLDEANWLRHAEGVLESADALQPVVDAAWASRSSWASAKGCLPFPSEADASIAIQMLLFSFAIENLLKASLVSHRKAEYEHQLKAHPVLPPELKQHDLVKLAIKARGRQGRGSTWHRRRGASPKAHPPGRVVRTLSGTLTLRTHAGIAKVSRRGGWLNQPRDKCGR